MLPTYTYTYCPVNYVHYQEIYTISLHTLWKKGKMLYAGGVADQPAKYVDAMMFIDSLLAELETDMIKQMGKNG